MKIRAQIKPNAKQAKVVSPATPDDVWLIATKAPAIDGRANKEAVELIATTLHLPKSAVTLKLGAKSKFKIFEIRE
jgi:ssr5011 protein